MKIQERKPALFVDMDGTLAEWKPIHIPVQVPSEKINAYIHDVLYQENYYRDLNPYKQMVDAVKSIIKDGLVDVYILSCYLPDNEMYPNASPLADKQAWLNEQFGEMLPKDHRIFVRDGEPKVENIPFALQDGDTILDDFTKNLIGWKLPGVALGAVKVVNPINDTHHSWQGCRVSWEANIEKIKEEIYYCINQTKKTARINEAAKTESFEDPDIEME